MERMKARLPFVYTENGLRGGRAAVALDIGYVDAEIPLAAMADARLVATWWTPHSLIRPKWRCVLWNGDFLVRAPGHLKPDVFRREHPATTGLGGAGHYADMLGMEWQKRSTVALSTIMGGDVPGFPEFGRRLDEVTSTDRYEMETRTRNLASVLVFGDDGELWTRIEEPKLTVSYHTAKRTVRMSVDTAFGDAAPGNSGHITPNVDTVSHVLFNLADMGLAEDFIRDHGLTPGHVDGLGRLSPLNKLVVAEPEAFAFDAAGPRRTPEVVQSPPMM